MSLAVCLGARRRSQQEDFASTTFGIGRNSHNYYGPGVTSTWKKRFAPVIALVTVIEPPVPGS